MKGYKIDFLIKHPKVLGIEIDGRSIKRNLSEKPIK